MDKDYIEGRKEELQAEFNRNQSRQVWLQGAFAELSELEKVLSKPKEKKESK